MAALATHPQWIAHSELDTLLQVLRQRGYTVVGPTISQDAIVYDEINAVADLPRGWIDRQQPGSYRIARRDDDALFGYVVGPHSWKKYLFPPVSTVATADRTPQGWQFNTADETPPQLAFLGVRACELAAIAIQDRVFMSDQYVDPIYQARRQACCLIAVNCAQAASTCFCTSMGTGPECTTGFDLALTELADGFLIDSGSSLGEALLAEFVHRPASEDELTAGTAARQQAIDQITKQLDTTNIRNLLLNNLDHPQWDEVAQRCLSCTNCTLVCPTCFCHSVGDVADLQGDHVDRVRQWDSCFNFDFSYVNGGVVRNAVRSRYRQWLTHKLATWFDQFDSSGCVGCGRCITWCPVAIDLTQEVAAIRESSA